MSAARCADARLDRCRALHTGSQVELPSFGTVGLYLRANHRFQLRFRDIREPSVHREGAERSRSVPIYPAADHRPPSGSNRRTWPLPSPDLPGLQRVGRHAKRSALINAEAGETGNAIIRAWGLRRAPHRASRRTLHGGKRAQGPGDPGAPRHAGRIHGHRPPRKPPSCMPATTSSSWIPPTSRWTTTTSRDPAATSVAATGRHPRSIACSARARRSWSRWRRSPSAPRALRITSHVSIAGRHLVLTPWETASASPAASIPTASGGGCERPWSGSAPGTWASSSAPPARAPTRGRPGGGRPLPRHGLGGDPGEASHGARPAVLHLGALASAARDPRLLRIRRRRES